LPDGKLKSGGSGIVPSEPIDKKSGNDFINSIPAATPSACNGLADLGDTAELIASRFCCSFDLG
jgi:hypothetical protein